MTIKERIKSAWRTVKIRRAAPYLYTFGGALLFVGVATWAFQAVLANRAIHHAKEDMKKGFAAVASDRLEPYRRSLVKSEEGCQTLVGVYFEARNPERLLWASESCLSNGLEIPEAFLGLAAGKEFTGMDTEAIRVLVSAADRFKDSPDFHFRIAQILKRRQNKEGATSAFLEATRRAPNNEQLALAALDYFSQVGDWGNARRAGENLRNAVTDSPEIKLLIAQALSKGGNAEGAKTLVDQAKTLLAAKPPEQMEQLKKTYGDLLGDAPRVPASVQTPLSKPSEKH